MESRIIGRKAARTLNAAEIDSVGGASGPPDDGGIYVMTRCFQCISDADGERVQDLGECELPACA